MIFLCDIGNTNTHLGLADERRVVMQADVPTVDWFSGEALASVRRFVGPAKLEGVALCSVVPQATPLVRKAISDLRTARPQANQRAELELRAPLELTAKTLRGLGIDYPKPHTIGPDRLANAVAAKQRFGAPVLAIGFGTATIFDVVDAQGNFVGGVIAPGLAAMTDYLHDKTALLPRVKIRQVKSAIGKSTDHAMLVGAVHGYRGLVRELIAELKRELKVEALPVVATGGYAKLIAAQLPEVTVVQPDLTLEGLRLVWFA